MTSVKNGLCACSTWRMKNSKGNKVLCWLPPCCRVCESFVFFFVGICRCFGERFCTYSSSDIRSRGYMVKWTIPFYFFNCVNMNHKYFYLKKYCCYIFHFCILTSLPFDWAECFHPAAVNCLFTQNCYLYVHFWFKKKYFQTFTHLCMGIIIIMTLQLLWIF